MRLNRAALAVALCATGLAAAGATSPARAAGPDEPQADVDYVYNQINFMSANYLQRYSGQDGEPGDMSATGGNLPPQVNGWQEFYQHWREQMTSAEVMGRFAPAIHYDDHLFFAPSASFFGPPPPYHSDVASVTIPGSTCPGEPVVIAGHPDSTPGLNVGNGSTYDDTSGVVMGMGELQALTRWWTAHNAWPTRTVRVFLFDAEEEGLYGSQYYADNLVPTGPQGRPVLAANMDQNGIEYPAHPFGTTKSTWGPGFWYTNVNATPLKDFSIYGDAGKKNIMANYPAVVHFRAALDQSVRQAFADLGARYNYSVPLENALEGGATTPAYLPGDVDTYSPVQDDTLGRTDQVPFIALGIPGYGIVGAFDSNAQDNPIGYPQTPLSQLGAVGLPQVAGYDTPRDNIQHLNLITSGTTGGGADSPTGSVELRRALELPMTWTNYLLARPEYAGADPAPSGPLALFEALPTAPSSGTEVSFNGAQSAIGNGSGTLTYAWDFGDGARGTGAIVHHAYAQDGWYDARLVVTDSSGRTSGYRQAIKVGKPAGAAPATDHCGRLSAGEMAAVTGSGPVGSAASTPATSPAIATPNTSAGGGSRAVPVGFGVLVTSGAAIGLVRRRRRDRATGVAPR
ncbi:MAG TPA: PKD domain-containing protein [Candidatus Angelobacter sp.]|jgi:hypothetical protein|nr:PKD domain-containing protein [Candidatus Angelobacter sp.]